MGTIASCLVWARSSLTHYYPANLSHWDPQEAEDFLGLHIEPKRRETISNVQDCSKQFGSGTAILCSDK